MIIEDGHTTALDKFIQWQWKKDYESGTSLYGTDQSKIMREVNEFYQERRQIQWELNDCPALVDGYALFCNHLSMPNIIPSQKLPIASITEKKDLLCTRYEGSTSQQLPVLTRFLPKGHCQFRICILFRSYSVL